MRRLHTVNDVVWEEINPNLLIFVEVRRISDNGNRNVTILHIYQ